MSDPPAGHEATIRVLVVEDFEPDLGLLDHALADGGLCVELRRVDTAAAFQAALDEGGWDLIISDWTLPGFGGLEALALARTSGLDLPFIIVSGTVDEEQAVSAMRAGACDFVGKSRLARLVPAIERELREATLRANRRELQAQLVHAERLASLGMVAASIGHEINNPLSVVIGNLHLMRRQLARLIEPEAPSLPEALGEVLARLDNVDEATARVRQVVADLSFFARADEHGTAPVDLRAPLAASLRMAAIEIRRRAQVVQDIREVPLVEASVSRLGQVFTNLLINAAHAIPEGHEHDHEIHVATRTDGRGRAVVEIRDTGCGIAAEHLPKLFEPFFTTKPLGTGTGLGLAICHRIVSSIGGEIEIESTVGKGTTMRVILPPRTARRSTPAEPAPTSPIARQRRRVLIIDDDALVGATLRRLLGVDHEAVLESDPRAALKRIAADKPFDVILCDLMMPGMTGMDLYNALEQTVPRLVEKIIFTSGGAFTREAQDFLARIRNRTLAKPFAIDDLMRLVDEAIGST